VGTATITHSLSSVQLKDVSEAALPADAPRERIERQAPAAHRKRSLDERATATELPSNSPPKADCKPSKGSDGHAGVIGVEGKVKRDATYLGEGEECGGEVCERWRCEGRHWSNSGSSRAVAALQASSNALKTTGKRQQRIGQNYCAA
jgi:hypothetical protein